MKSRPPHRMRPVTIEPFPSAAAGAVVICQGNTRVLCTASVSTDLPPWLAPRRGEQPTQGWVTAEYAMLPGSTTQRKRRGPDSRATEIQRLIGRVLRQAVDMTKMPGLCVTVDCDVLVADGGTRTASITGGWVALARALEQARQQGLLHANPLAGPVAAISVGIVNGTPVLDLDYQMDSTAEVDLNVAMDRRGNLIEIQGTAERQTFSRTQLDAMLDLATKGVRSLFRLQRAALRS